MAFYTQTTTKDRPRACLPPTQPILYTPSSPRNARTPTTTVDLLYHLLNNPKDRLQILADARRQGNHAFTTLWVEHPLLRTLIRLHPNDTDEDLFNTIYNTLIQIRLLQQARELHIDFLSPPTPEPELSFSDIFNFPPTPPNTTSLPAEGPEDQECVTQ
jgi:hypothetical protein